ncbi:hypothetical protein IAS59_000879 [Cryptococcus gattii]
MISCYYSRWKKRSSVIRIQLLYNYFNKTFNQSISSIKWKEQRTRNEKGMEVRNEDGMPENLLHNHFSLS